MPIINFGQKDRWAPKPSKREVGSASACLSLLPHCTRMAAHDALCCRIDPHSSQRLSNCSHHSFSSAEVTRARTHRSRRRKSLACPPPRNTRCLIVALALLGVDALIARGGLALRRRSAAVPTTGLGSLVDIWRRLASARVEQPSAKSPETEDTDLSRLFGRRASHAAQTRLKTRAS